MRDNGSMHGTWVNDKKIPPGRDVAISTDDVLTFGAEVVNGSGKSYVIVPIISRAGVWKSLQLLTFPSDICPAQSSLRMSVV